MGARRLQPLDINCDINTAIGILQDIDRYDTFDEDGLMTTADFDNALFLIAHGFANVGGQFRLDTSKLVDLENLTREGVKCCSVLN
jgi:hypothetical protein